MPKFLMQATFSPDGVKNLIEQGGTKREQQLQDLVWPLTRIDPRSLMRIDPLNHV